MGFFTAFRVKANLNSLLKEVDEYNLESKWAEFEDYIKKANFLNEKEKNKYLKDAKNEFERRAIELGLESFFKGD